ncbi:MAG: metallophosphoesterase [Planctomycetota bacterium]
MILVHELFYNFILLGIDAAILIWLWQRPGWWSTAIALLTHLASCFVVARVLSAESFFFMRLAAWGVFVHFPLLVLVASCFPRQPIARRLALGLTALLAIAIAVDAFLIEPHQLQLSHRVITSSKLDRPLRIVVVADLQTDQFGDYERGVLDRAAAQQADLILLAGDYVQTQDSARWESLRDELRAHLQSIAWEAPLGVYAVGGNSDWYQWPEIFAGTSIQVLEQTASLALDDGQITLTGLSVTDSFDPELQVAAADGFHILLGHAPDFALGQVEADLLVAGHTHGGQVRLPGLGPVITASRIPRGWAANLTEIQPGQHLLVSRGIGMERLGAPRLRFLCRPELAILDIRPASP